MSNAQIFEQMLEKLHSNIELKSKEFIAHEPIDLLQSLVAVEHIPINTVSAIFTTKLSKKNRISINRSTDLFDTFEITCLPTEILKSATLYLGIGVPLKFIPIKKINFPKNCENAKFAFFDKQIPNCSFYMDMFSVSFDIQGSAIENRPIAIHQSMVNSTVRKSFMVKYAKIASEFYHLLKNSVETIDDDVLCERFSNVTIFK